MRFLRALAVTILSSRTVLGWPTQEILSASVEDTDKLGNATSTFVPPKDWTFPFAPGAAPMKDTLQFVRNLYLGDADRKPWISHTEARDPDVFPWMNKRIGNLNLVPDTDADEYADNTRNPDWRWSESWRIVTLYNTLLNTRAAGKQGNGRVVNEYFSTIKQDNLGNALFPKAVRILLENNERVILNALEANPETLWVGNVASSAPYRPFEGVKVTHSSDAMYAQKGPVGPMSLEASFILASQVAGIDWRRLRGQIDKDAMQTGIYWVSGIIPEEDKSHDEVIHERRGTARERTLGYLSRRGAPLTGSPDAGFYIVFDIDPKIDGYTNLKKNVFVFASHVMDQHSRFLLNDQARLHNMRYEGEYTPDKSAQRVRKIPEGNNGTDVRFYAHGHAAVMPFHLFMDWFGQKIPNQGPGLPMPKYDQIGEMHLYYLPEDEDDLWPRRSYLNAPTADRMTLGHL